MRLATAVLLTMSVSVLKVSVGLVLVSGNPLMVGEDLPALTAALVIAIPGYSISLVALLTLCLIFLVVAVNLVDLSATLKESVGSWTTAVAFVTESASLVKNAVSFLSVALERVDLLSLFVEVSSWRLLNNWMTADVGLTR